MVISVCVTNFNRTKLLYEALANVLHDDRVSEIIISDDCSREEIYQAVVENYKDHQKVRIYRNLTNEDCYRNKAIALSRATNVWCCLWDSDNLFDKTYIDRLENLWQAGLNQTTIYTPSFARPHFDFTSVAGVNITHSNIGGLVHSDKVTTMLNAANYFVNSHEYLKVFEKSIDPVTSDSIFMAYRWLDAENSIYVVPDLSYQHRVNNHGEEEPSHYGRNVRRTPQGFHDSIIQKLKDMR